VIAAVSVPPAWQQTARAKPAEKNQALSWCDHQHRDIIRAVVETNPLQISFLPLMPLLPRKAVLAVAAVIDVAMQDHGQPISAKTLAARHGLPPRHLEPVLQALVRCGILKGIRGPRGGYELARERRRVTVNEILRAAGTVEDTDELHGGSELVTRVVLPAMAAAEHEFGVALSRINIEDRVRGAEALGEGPADSRAAEAGR
jgi:Rrf2 family transcriptional regulator, iron-sulfur cluster assembly transcription factor